MTARAEYTAEEWALLSEAPMLAELAVAFADGSRLLETLAEVARAGVVRYQGAARHPGNELVAALARPQREDATERKLPELQKVSESSAEALPRLRAAALKWCRDAMALLQERSNPTEAAGYAAWIMDSAVAAATAARHKESLFAPKGPAVDAAERHMLAQLAEALGVEVGALPAGEGPEERAGDGSTAGTPDVTDGPIHPA